MTIKEILYGGSGALVLIMSFLQISKININPWTAIFGWIGKQLNHEVLSKVAGLEKRMNKIQADVDTIRDEGRERHAKDCRVRILRFADEIYLGTNHSQEHTPLFFPCIPPQLSYWQPTAFQAILMYSFRSSFPLIYKAFSGLV